MRQGLKEKYWRVGQSNYPNVEDLLLLSGQKIFNCSFCGGPKIKPEPEHPEKRTVFKPTRKVGCKASIKAQKKFSGEKIFVNFNNVHTGHELNTLKTWTQSRLSPATRAWLQNVVATGIDWKTFKRMTRDESDKLELLGSVSLDAGTQLEVPEILRVSYQDFYNFRRKEINQTRQLHPNCWQSLIEYINLIISAGGIATLEDVPEDRLDGIKVFCFAFCSSWQIEVLQKYSSILFLDSTHNVCYSLEDRNRKAFLYTILVKHDAAGCGIPVAFMITDSETQRPLARWLTWLKKKSLIPIDPKIMIDCSATEMAAISSVFENPQIRLCHWHMLRAMRSQANKKIRMNTLTQVTMKAKIKIEHDKQIRNSAIQDFLGLMRTKTVLEFGDVWKDYYKKFLDLGQKEWLSYLDTTWLKHPEKWWYSNRGVSTINIRIT